MQSKGTTYWNNDRIMWLIIGTVISVIVVLLLKKLSNVLLPFFAACVIAYFLNPLVKFNLRRFRLRYQSVAVGFTLIEVLLVLGTIAYFILPVVIGEINTLLKMVDNYASHNNETPLIPDTINRFIRNIDAEEVENLIESGKLDGFFARGETIVAAVVHALFHMLQWLMMFIYVVFIMVYYDEISAGFKKLTPRRYREQVEAVFGDVTAAMNHYFRGQGVMALLAMVFYSVGFSIAGLPMAIIMGVSVGVLYMIPYFQYITIVPVTVICFITSLGGDVAFWPLLVKCLGVYVVNQTILDYVLTPHVLGKAMGLNPAIILLALSVWGSLLGVLGMLIALPATTVILSYYKRYISDRE